MNIATAISSPAERFGPDDFARALLNILDDSDTERKRLQDTQRAVVNILEDSATERRQLEITQKAFLNILEDFGAERKRLEEIERATLNILDDLAQEGQERAHLEERFRAILETAPDAIVIVDEAGSMVLVNGQTEKLFGYSRQELLGQPVEILLPERYRTLHPAHRQTFTDRPTLRSVDVGLELSGRAKDGTEFPTEILLSPLQTDEGILISAAIRDVTRTREVEHQIRRSLKEKEVLLQEIHHRVKNNLQIIASLLSLQSGYVTDASTLAQFQACEGRIRSMALIHEKLYQSETLATVDLADYTVSLVNILVRSYSSDSDVAVEFALAPVEVGIDTAVPLGLVINELVTNAMKYAFPNGRSGHLLVSLNDTSDGWFGLRFQDDGIGFEPHFRLAEADSLGLRLVRMFAKQLRAELAFESVPGNTTFDLRFQDRARTTP